MFKWLKHDRKTYGEGVRRETLSKIEQQILSAEHELGRINEKRVQLWQKTVGEMLDLSEQGFPVPFRDVGSGSIEDMIEPILTMLKVPQMFHGQIKSYIKANPEQINQVQGLLMEWAKKKMAQGLNNEKNLINTNKEEKSTQ